jgi:hypothetical protein
MSSQGETKKGSLNQERAQDRCSPRLELIRASLAKEVLALGVREGNGTWPWIQGQVMEGVEGGA